MYIGANSQDGHASYKGIGDVTTVVLTTTLEYSMAFLFTI